MLAFHHKMSTLAVKVGRFSIDAHFALRDNPIMAPSLSRFRPALITLALALVTLATFWPATRNQFVNIDDPTYLTDNLDVKNGLSSKGVHYAFTTGDTGNWHPLTWLSLMLDVEMFGME